MTILKVRSGLEPWTYPNLSVVVEKKVNSILNPQNSYFTKHLDLSMPTLQTICLFFSNSVYDKCNSSRALFFTRRRAKKLAYIMSHGKRLKILMKVDFKLLNRRDYEH